MSSVFEIILNCIYSFLFHFSSNVKNRESTLHDLMWRLYKYIFKYMHSLDQEIENEVNHIEELQSNSKDAAEVLVNAAEIAKRNFLLVYILMTGFSF